MSESKESRPKETWLDWLPDQLQRASQQESLITREQLLIALRQDHDISITERTLQNWEADGWIPGAVRRWHDGATRALYPQWMPFFVSLASYIRGLRKQFSDDTDLPGHMRAHARAIALQWATGRASGKFQAQIKAALKEFIADYEEAGGVRPHRIELQFFEEHGTHPFDHFDFTFA